MSSLLALQPPAPTSTLSFDQYFRGDSSELVRLSRRRRQIVDALASNDAAAVVVVDEYRRQWLDFWRRNIVHANAAARSRQPLAFEWQVQLVGTESHSIRYSDPSPLLETACVTLASAALHQRLAAAAARLEDAEREAATAMSTLRWLRSEVLEPMARRKVDEPPRRDPNKLLSISMEMEVRSRAIRVREPEVFSPGLVEALEASVGGQLSAKRAVAAVAERQPLVAAGHFFEAARLFGRAHSTLVAEETLARSQRKTTAMAHRYLAEALVEEASPDVYGVAVALAREATAIDPTNDALRRFNDEMRERNRIEFGMKTVPESEAIVLDLQRERGPHLVVDRDLDSSHFTLAVPLPQAMM